jgi:hypothetical protein
MNSRVANECFAIDRFCLYAKKEICRKIHLRRRKQANRISNSDVQSEIHEGILLTIFI